MKPLLTTAAGLGLVLLDVFVGGWDLVPDPVGWVLAVLATRQLPVPTRGTLTGIALVALVAACLLWVPSVAEAVDRLHVSVGWAAGLPQVAYLTLLCHALSRRARSTGDTPAGSWLLWLAGGNALLGLVPALVWGPGLLAAAAAVLLAALVIALTTILMLAAYSSRPWALADAGPRDADHP